jgi:hypothetical protein
MASWVLSCKNCGKSFEHSKISDTLANYYYLAKEPALSPKRSGHSMPASHEKRYLLFARPDV